MSINRTTISLSTGRMKGNINFSSQDQTENISKKNKHKRYNGKRDFQWGKRKRGKEKIENAARMRGHCKLNNLKSFERLLLLTQ